MKMNFSKEWFSENLEKEDKAVISAGARSCINAHAATAESKVVVNDEAPLLSAFAKLVCFRRRDKGLSVEKLAEQARIDLEELVSIEQKPGYTPDARTVCQLADVLRLPTDRLLELSGNVVIRDHRLVQEAVKFAASSKSMEKLNADEKRDLEEFVRKLSR